MAGIITENENLEFHAKGANSKVVFKENDVEINVAKIEDVQAVKTELTSYVYSQAASNVIDIKGVSTSNVVKTKNHAVVTYTGNGDTQTIETGISSVDFTQPNNGSGFYNKRVAGGFAVIADDAVDLIDSTNDTSSVDNWTAVNDANLSVSNGVLSVNADDTDYPYAKRTFTLNKGSYAISCTAEGTAPKLKVMTDDDITSITPLISGSMLYIINVPNDDTNYVIRLECGTSDDDATATFSNLSILPVAGNGSGSCVANTSNVHFKSRSSEGNNQIYDGLRGVHRRVFSNLTNVEFHDDTDDLSEFTLNGVVIEGAQVGQNELDETYVLYQTLFTHIKWGMTSHNKFYVEAYNPVTKEGTILYSGSASAGHQVPHSAGVELGYTVVKNLVSASQWRVSIKGIAENGKKMLLNTDSAKVSTGYYSNITSTSINGVQTSDNYMLYYKCKSETWTIGTYIGTGSTGNKIITTDVNGKEVKLRDVVIKRIDDVGDWGVYNSETLVRLELNTPDKEATDGYRAILLDYGFVLNTSAAIVNALNGQYLYMGYIDTNATTTPDDSYYMKPTHSTDPLAISTTTLNSDVSISVSKDALGYKNVLKNFNQVIDASQLEDGKYYVGIKEDGTNMFVKNKPMYRDYEAQFAQDSRYVLKEGKWYLAETAELLINGTFKDGTTNGWSAVNAEISVENGMLKVDDSADSGSWSSARTNILLEIGKRYSISIGNFSSNATDVTNKVHISIYSGYNCGLMATGDVYYHHNGTSYAEFVATASENTLSVGIHHEDIAYFDNISIYKTQPTLGTTPEAITWLSKPVQVANGIIQDLPSS